MDDFIIKMGPQSVLSVTIGILNPIQILQPFYRQKNIRLEEDAVNSEKKTALRYSSPAVKTV
jgi:hypothetical protein